MNTVKIPFLLILALLTASRLVAQDVYSLENTLRFSDYLMKTRQYELAAQELERAVYLAEDKVPVQLMLLKSYDLGGNYSLETAAIERFFGDSLSRIPSAFGKLYLRSLILDRQTARAEYFLTANNLLETADRNNSRLSLLLLRGNWESARAFSQANEELHPGLIKLSRETADIRYKKPVLALGMSALLPGSGKFYTGNWKDGLISFVFVAANAYQSYRGFNKNGVESVYGWVFGGLAAGFYGGNLYGSWKAAKNVNRQLDDEIRRQTLELYRSDL